MTIVFRPLRASEIEVKVKQVSEKGLVCLLYKTARTDMDLLDETVGAENWTCDYKEIKGNLYAGIGINIGRPDDFSEHIWKWDCGIESREDGEGNEKKGEASDAFKRAGFKWGIGRTLYSAPFIWIPADKCNIKTGKSGRPACYDKFFVEKIAYDDTGKQITGLAIWNQTTNQRAYVWTL